MANLNSVVVSGNLTKDPELRTTQGGTSVCKLRLAVNERRKVNDDWVDVPNYFDVTVWGTQGENCATYLSKGAAVGVQGRLQWREWESQEGGKRQAVDIVADRVQWPPKGSKGNNAGGQSSAPAESDVPADMDGLGQQAQPVGVPADADIPF